MKEKNVTIGLVQMSMSHDISENLVKALTQIDEAAKKGCHIVCLPELFTTRYFPQDVSKLPFELAETIPGRTTAPLAEAAKKNKIILVGGTIFEKAGKKFYNTAVVFNEKGKLIGTYRKLHVPHDPFFYEQAYFSKGDKFCICKTRHGNISVSICYDQWFPEAARAVAMMGADIILYPTAIGCIEGNNEKYGSWQDAWETIQRGHAIANSVVVAAANRAGKEGKLQFWGGSFICNQFGKVLARGGYGEEIIIATVDVTVGKKIREEWRFATERRHELYKNICKKWDIK